jgi:hypothetical protein
MESEKLKNNNTCILKGCSKTGKWRDTNTVWETLLYCEGISLDVTCSIYSYFIFIQELDVEDLQYCLNFSVVIWMLMLLLIFISSMSFSGQVKLGYRKNWIRNTGTPTRGLMIPLIILNCRVIESLKTVTNI